MSKRFIILIGDGMADTPADFPQGKTPLVAAHHPHMDFLARVGEMGLVQTVPEDMHSGSDICNLTILGYDPKKYYTGRAPIEAAGSGLKLGPDEAAFRCNLVGLREEQGKLIMDDYAAGHISDADAKELIQTLNQNFANGQVKFYPSVSYRNLCIIKNVDPGAVYIPPPHDILNQPLEKHLPNAALNDVEALVLELMAKSRELFKNHPVNQRRRAAKKKTVDSIWLWGQGKSPSLPTLKERAGVSGVVISGVDLIRGLGKLAGLEIVKVPGATGYIDTNYEGKVNAGLEALAKGDNFIYLHIEAPDEAGHAGDLALKIKAIELFDQKVVGPFLEGLKKYDDWMLLLMPDHTTPIKLRTHHTDPVPFIVVSSKQVKAGKELERRYTENDAANTKIKIDSAHTLLDRYFFAK